MSLSVVRNLSSEQRNLITQYAALEIISDGSVDGVEKGQVLIN